MPPPVLDWLSSTPAGNRLGQAAVREIRLVYHANPWWTAPLEPLRWINTILGSTPHVLVTLVVFGVIALVFAALRGRRVPGGRPFAASFITLLLTLGGGSQALRYIDTEMTGGVEWRAPEGASFRLANFHAHTQASGGVLMPEDVAAWHYSRGYSVLAITDSNGMRGVERAREWVARTGASMIIVPGEEYRLRTGGTHLLFLNITTPILPSERTPLQAIAEARAQGGIALAAHPWTADLSPQELVAAGVAGFEITNGHVAASDETLELVRQGPLAMLGDLDFRHGQYPLAATVLPASADTPEKVQRALERGECAALFLRGRTMAGGFSYPGQLMQNVRSLFERRLSLLFVGLLAWACTPWIWKALRRAIPICRLAPGRALALITGLAMATAVLAAWSMWWQFRTGWYPRTEWAVLAWAIGSPLCWWALPAASARPAPPA